jgi:hypothetical protein
MTSATGQMKANRFRVKIARAVLLTVVMAVMHAASSSLAEEAIDKNSIGSVDLPGKSASVFEAKFSLEISHGEIESEMEKPQFDADYDGASVKLSSVLRRITPSDDVISKLLMRGGIASKGVLAFGGLRVGYGQIFLHDSVVDTGRTGTAWEAPGCFQIKRCFRF